MGFRPRERKSGAPGAFWDIMGKVFGKAGLKRRIRENQVFMVWDKAVGEGIRKNARPVAVNEGVLTVEARNNTWLQELSFLREDLIRELNAALGWDAISDLRFRVATTEIAPVESGDMYLLRVPRLDQPKKVDPRTADEIEKHLDGISDPELRNALRGFMERGAGRKGK